MMIMMLPMIKWCCSPIQQGVEVTVCLRYSAPHPWAFHIDVDADDDDGVNEDNDNNDDCDDLGSDDENDNGQLTAHDHWSHVLQGVFFSLVRP